MHVIDWGEWMNVVSNLFIKAYYPHRCLRIVHILSLFSAFLCIAMNTLGADGTHRKNAHHQRQFILAWPLLSPQTNCNRFILIKLTEIQYLLRVRCPDVSDDWRNVQRKYLSCEWDKWNENPSHFMWSMASHTNSSQLIMDWWTSTEAIVPGCPSFCKIPVK